MSQRKRIFQTLTISVFIVIYFCLWVVFKNALIYQQQSTTIKLTIIMTSLIVLYYSLKVIFTKINYYQMMILTINYVIMIYILLLHRDRHNQNISTNFYLWKWLDLLFTNQTVFINVIGNMIIFIPLGIIINQGPSRWHLKIIACLIIIVIIELLQYIFQKGIFDYIDIILNMIGAAIGIIISIRKGKTYEQK